MFFESERRVPQGLKPAFFQPCSARLKPRPFKTRSRTQTRSTTHKTRSRTRVSSPHARRGKPRLYTNVVASLRLAARVLLTPGLAIPSPPTPGAPTRARSSRLRFYGRPFFLLRNGGPHSRAPRRLRASSAALK